MNFIVKSDSTIYCGIEIFCRGFVFLPKSLVELNSILLKVTFGSYKFFGFFKRANYNSIRNLGEMSVYSSYSKVWQLDFVRTDKHNMRNIWNWR